MWVDDLIIAASDGNALKVVEMLTARFRMKDLGKLRHFLGNDLEQSDGCVKMSQKKKCGKAQNMWN